MAKIYQDRIMKLASQQKPFLKPNILHQFASYNTIFTLSGLTEEEFSSHDFLINPVHDIIAKTGGIGGDAKVRSFAAAETGDGAVAERAYKQQKYALGISVLERAHDMSIDNVNITSTTSPNLERGLGNFTKMEFEISEAYGVTLIEKINAATGLNGYQDYMDAPLLLTIEFKGFDEKGAPVKNQPVVRKVPIGITRVDFDVNESGARYQLLAVPYPELAYDDRYKFPRTDVPVAVNTPTQWAADVMEVLNVTMMENEIKEKKRELKDKYKFSIDSRVLEYGKKYASNETNATISANTKEYDVFDEVENLQPTPKVKTIEGTAGQTTSLTKFFEDAIRSLTGYKDLAENFWVSYLSSVGVPQKILDDELALAKLVNSDEMQSIVMEHQYVDWFKIKTTVRTDVERFDRITRMHPKEIEYRAVPYKLHVLKLVRPGVSVSGVDWRSQVHKDYNYIYTGANLDIQNLRINYKTAYYMRNVRGKDKGVAEQGLFNWVTETTKEIFGREKYPEPLKPLRQYPSTNKGRNVLNVTQDSPKSQEFYDYLTNPEADMIRIEMDILGDPAYICQDAFMPIHKDKIEREKTFSVTYSDKYNSFNSDSFQPIINLAYRIPDEVDVKEGTMFSGAKFRDENLFFNGIYQVNKIESKFDQGQFTQTLFCTRFNNQQGAGTTPLTASAQKSSAEIIETIRDHRKLPSIKELLQKQKDKKLEDVIGDINDIMA